MELELQNVPHHPEIVPEEGEERRRRRRGRSRRNGHQRRRPGGGRERVDGIQSQPLLNVRVGKQLSPQYWWQNHYPNLTSRRPRPIYLRELFPAELVGVMVQGSAATPVGSSEFGVGYKFYVGEQQLRGQQPGGSARRQVVGRPRPGAVPDGRRIAAVRRGRRHLPRPRRADGQELAEDNVVGFEGQLEISSFLFRPNRRGASRSGRRAPATTCSRRGASMRTGSRSTALEQLESPRIQRAERRHLAGLNYRPYPQIALKGEFYRSQPLERDFIHSEEGGSESRSTASRPRRCSFSDESDVTRRVLLAGLLVFLWTGSPSAQGAAVRRHRQQGESGEDAAGRRAAAHLHEAVAHVVARRVDGAGRLGRTSAIRQVFSRQVLDRSVREMADFWVQQTITQGLTPPSTQRSARAMLRFVASVPGAISYVLPG